jgi:putative flippase GtrA
LSGALQKIKTKYFPLFHAAKFGIAVASGFLVTEIILTMGVFLAYKTLSVPSINSFAPTLIELNVIAFGVGVTVAFFLNEKITVNEQVVNRRRARNTVLRLLKYQLISLAGNIVTIAVQLVLLRALSVPPSLGNIVGGIISFPISYFFSMKVVWRISALSPQTSLKETRAAAAEKTLNDLFTSTR